MILCCTIFLMVATVWNLFALVIVLEEGEICIYPGDDLLLKIIKIYWWIIIVSLITIILFAICNSISEEIVCNLKKGDYPTCEKIKKEEN